MQTDPSAGEHTTCIRKSQMLNNPIINFEYNSYKKIPVVMESNGYINCKITNKHLNINSYDHETSASACSSKVMRHFAKTSAKVAGRSKWLSEKLLFPSNNNPAP